MRSMEVHVHLPDEVLLEILVRVKEDVPAALFRCAAVCKRWRGLAADPSFLRRCWPPGSAASSSFQGFFYKGTSTCLPTCFVPVSRSVLGGSHRALSSFFPSAPAGCLEGAPLASRHGLLLLAGNLDGDRRRRLTVCNPVAGTFDLLPPLEWVPCIGHAIITGIDCRRPLPYYKVLVVDTKLNVHMFSSDEASWSRKCFGAVPDGVRPYDVGEAIVRCGSAHWVYYNYPASCWYTIDVNFETAHISTKKLATITEPPLSPPRLSLATDGSRTLSVLWMRTEDFKVEIWKREDNEDSIDDENDDNDTSMWHCTQVVELKRPGMEIMNSFILGEKCGTLVIEDGLQRFKDGHQRVYFAHLETGIMKEVMSCRDLYLAKGSVVAFEMDWLAFFVSRLRSR